LREIASRNFDRRLRFGECAHFASPARCSGRCAVCPNGEQTIGIGRESYLTCYDVEVGSASITSAEQTNNSSTVQSYLRTSIKHASGGFVAVLRCLRSSF
jgi:hypothetical protein